MKKVIRLTEDDLARIVRRVIQEQSIRTPEEDQEFMDWVETVQIFAFVAPNPYKDGNLKVGLRISPYVESESSKYEIVKNLIEQVNIVTYDGKSVYQDIGGEKLSQGSNTSFGYKKIMGSDIVFYDEYNEDSELLQNIKKFVKPGKTNRFLVTVTPRANDKIKINRMDIFKTKPAVLIVEI